MYRQGVLNAKSGKNGNLVLIYIIFKNIYWHRLKTDIFSNISCHLLVGQGLYLGGGVYLSGISMKEMSKITNVEKILNWEKNDIVEEPGKSSEGEGGDS